jgi:TRAP-type C4-dicarboxylate transport system permease small subunit
VPDTPTARPGLLALVCAIILLRLGFLDVSFGWSDEIVELLFAWMVFLGTAIVWGRRQHIVVDLIPQMLAGTRAAQVLEGARRSANANAGCL